MKQPRAADRFTWTIELLAVDPDDRILEVGCGHGIAVSLICENLNGGSILAVDRSATMIDMARKRNAEWVAKGTADFQTAALHQADLRDLHFDTIFAINVGLFWRQDPSQELSVLKMHLKDDGRLILVHESPPGSTGPCIPKRLSTLLEQHGFAVTDLREQELERTCVGCVVAMRE